MLHVRKEGGSTLVLICNCKFTFDSSWKNVKSNFYSSQMWTATLYTPWHFGSQFSIKTGSESAKSELKILVTQTPSRSKPVRALPRVILWPTRSEIERGIIKSIQIALCPASVLSRLPSAQSLRACSPPIPSLINQPRFLPRFRKMHPTGWTLNFGNFFGESCALYRIARKDESWVAWTRKRGTGGGIHAT